MTAHDRTTLRRMREGLERAADLPLVSLEVIGVSREAALLALKAVEEEREEQLFRIALKCGCTIRLYFDKPPMVEQFKPHPDAECLIVNDLIAFVVE
jgi:hypothetical protein